jgi:hypothetical protein
MGIHSPNAVLDLTKPILSLRNQDESIQREFVNKAKELKLAAQSKRGSTILPVGNRSVISAQYSKTRVRTREGKRLKRNNNDLETGNLKSKSKKKKSHSRSPSNVRPTSKGLKIRKKKKRSKMSEKVAKRAQAGSVERIDYKSDQKSISPDSNKPNIRSFGLHHDNTKSSNISPPNFGYLKVEKENENEQNIGVTTPMTSEIGGIFGMNMNDESFNESNGFGINILGSKSQFTDYNAKSHKIPIIDWADSQIFQMVLNGNTELNKDSSNRFFKPDEIDYIVHMMKKRYKDFKTTDMLMPFFRKGKNTLQLLMDSLEIGQIYEKIDTNYQEITLENCFKILIRCKMCFEARNSLKIILTDIAAHEILLKDVFQKIENHLESSTDEEEREDLRRKGETITFYAKNIIRNIRKFQNDHKVFGNTFVFSNRKIDSNIRREIGELRKLLELYELYIPQNNPKEMVERPDISEYRYLKKVNKKF